MFLIAASKKIYHVVHGDRLASIAADGFLWCDVGDCVPFYFCPRSVMLYVIRKGVHQGLACQDGQKPSDHSLSVSTLAGEEALVPCDEGQSGSAAMAEELCLDRRAVGQTRFFLPGEPCT